MAEAPLAVSPDTMPACISLTHLHVGAGLEYIGCGDLCPSYLVFLLHFTFLWWLPKFNTVSGQGQGVERTAAHHLVLRWLKSSELHVNSSPERKLAGCILVMNVMQSQWKTHYKISVNTKMASKLYFPGRQSKFGKDMRLW